MHAISSYRGNRPTHRDKQVTNPQTGPITIHCTAKLSMQCNYYMYTIYKNCNDYCIETQYAHNCTGTPCAVEFASFATSSNTHMHYAEY